MAMNDIDINTDTNSTHDRNENEDKDFKPTFSKRTRTTVYILCMVLGIISYILTVTTSAMSAPVWLTVTCATLTAAPGYIAAAFGVHYDGINA
ncbi:hypothetical protein [Bifidobacterium sp. ESL0704]|uniref:hypothetical protein n=1 Tax=Bifidobacterium sp. ESL0704 TaxID=2983219 RepID=UPI0023F72ACB|nr:hypothetical protein [Bifidobacterium sp. ESL0704]WEV53073.1 hypothetical protein OZX64_00795 [Bifidobacterium sp. ESL0704]